jgi:septal ring factor EnvC (AmiA/AmiB activator)
MQAIASFKPYKVSKLLRKAVLNAILFVFGTTLFANFAKADTAKEYKQKLNAIGGEISTLKKQLNQNQSLYKSEQDKVFELEKEIDTVRSKIKAGQRQVGELQEKIYQIEVQQQTISKQQEKMTEAFKQLLITTYKSPPPSRIEMLLQQDSPYALGRLQNYYGYYTDAINLKLEELNQQLLEKQAISQKHDDALAELVSQQAKLDKQTKALNLKRDERAKSVNRLASSLDSDKKRLDKLTKDRARLDSLLAALERERERLRKAEEKEIEQAKLANKTNQATTPVQRRVFAPLPGGFKKQKGRLTAPVDGKQVYGFGKRIPESGMTSEGVLYQTNKSVPVHSVYSGRVIFADWLKGFGRLIIVDHGDDHISLYGHNNVLLKAVGDMVKTNEVIASSGTTGGQKSPSLYFEIRNKTNPVNPKIWLN